jgi:Fic family protein
MNKPSAANRAGRFVSTIAFNETVNAFVPAPLPPDPAVDISGTLISKLSDADRAIGRLDGIAMMLPETGLFLYMYVRKEAVLSSQIEGTQSTLDDLLLFENVAMLGQPIDDITEVSNYVDAMMYGLGLMRDDTPSGLPLCLRLIREMHGRLLQSGRGEQKEPGEFRRSQNWIGGTRPGNATYVPPPVDELLGCLDHFEKFLYDETIPVPPLIKAGLLHVQFESIHPFLDGNGRIGRLLIALFLVERRVLQEPLLYLSLYFKANREDYYRLLQEVRKNGSWEAWLEFFLDGVAETANNAFDSASRIVQLFREDRQRISVSTERANTALRIHEELQKQPFVTAHRLTTNTGLTTPTVNSALQTLEALGVVREITGKKRSRVYCYQGFMDILDDGAGSRQRGASTSTATPIEQNIATD